MLENILNVIQSSSFSSRLNNINRNYSNLKQEHQIRNSILELLNDNFIDSSYKAFAEHPREKSQKIDLSIAKEYSSDPPYTIELKFQYTNDFKQFKGFDKIIIKDFDRSLYKKKCDMFVLIVSYWNKEDKVHYDNQWGIRPEHTMSKYLALNDNWQINIKNVFAIFEGVELHEVAPITVKDPYPTHYHFYIMTRNN